MSEPTAAEARSKLFTEIAIAAPNIRAQKTLEVYADAYADAEVRKAQEPLAMLEALAKRYGKAEIEHRLLHVIVVWCQDDRVGWHFAYHAGTPYTSYGKTRAEAEALLAGKELSDD